MRAFVVRFGFAFAALLLLATVTVIGSRQTPQKSASHSAAAEVARIRAHLERVETDLRSADISRLSPAQRAARAKHIEVLRGYREAGVFPHNHVFESRYSPVFVDEHGTHCAVGFLIARSGRQDIVDRVARSRNYATVPQLADDPELVAWLGEAGLSLEEAARIQPAYNGPCCSVDPARRPTSHGYATASMLATGLGGGMAAWNLFTDRSSDEERKMRGTLGVAVGLGEVALGGLGIVMDRGGDRDIESGHIFLNFAMGLASTALGVRTLIGEPARRPAATQQQSGREALAMTVSPWRPQGRGGAGVRLNLRF